MQNTPDDYHPSIIATIRALRDRDPAALRISVAELLDKVFTRSLAVVGRRDPSNDELCIAGVGPDRDPDDLARAEDLFEMVTGPEAEALLSLITTKLENGRREGELGAVVLTGEQLDALHDANGTMN